MMPAPHSTCTPLVGLPYRKFMYTVISVIVGAVALRQTHLTLQSKEVQAQVTACEKAPWTRAGVHKFLKNHRDFEPLLGGSFACLVTQFLDRLVEEDPTGMIAWVSCLCVCLPAIVAIGGGGTERSCRAVAVPVRIRIAPGGAVRGNRSCGPLGVGAVVHVGQTSSSRHSLSETGRGGARVCALCAFVRTAAVFSSSRESYAWTLSAGCLAGPALALLPVACWSMNPPSPPHSPDDKASSRATRARVLSYQFAGALSFVMWAAVVAKSFGHHRLDVPRTLVGNLWMNAHDFVRFMTIDTVFLYLGTLSYVGYAETSAVPTTLVRTLVLGPGAALAVTLADLEQRRSPLAKLKQN